MHSHSTHSLIMPFIIIESQQYNEMTLYRKYIVVLVILAIVLHQYSYNLVHIQSYTLKYINLSLKVLSAVKSQTIGTYHTHVIHYIVVVFALSLSFLRYC